MGYAIIRTRFQPDEAYDLEKIQILSRQDKRGKGLRKRRRIRGEDSINYIAS